MQEALFWERRADGHLVCELCPRECVLAEGQLGACGVRKAMKGKLYAMTYGQPCAMHIDPVEKKPLFHFHPGERIFSIATIGCNLFCDFCQNWEISKDRWSDEHREPQVRPARVVEIAKKEQCKLIAFTYTEPTIFYEYMLDIAKLAKKQGMACVIVSNGYISEEPLRRLIPFISAANIDLKGGKKFYQTVCKVPDYEYIKHTIITLKKAGVHVEVTNLLIPGANDSEKEIEALVTWLSENTGRETPLHFSAFHPDFKMLNKESTPAKTLLRARELARKHLDYVYIGNVGGVENNTCCPKCGTVVIERKTYEGLPLLQGGKCQNCGHTIVGCFS